MNRFTALCAVVFSCANLSAQTPIAGQPPVGVAEVRINIPTTDSLTLPGILTLPPLTPTSKLQVRPPVAVLGQGSGVQDMDATIGPNKFFRQIAWGLAARGVASIRYDRRAKVSPENFMAHADLDHEIVIDAAAALAFAQTRTEIDPHAVFFVGHSLAAQLAPDVVARRLSQQPNSVRGMALLSGIAQPIQQVLDAQIATLGKAQGATDAQLAEVTKAWDALFDEARDPNTPAGKALGIGAQLPASYWRDWLRRDPVATMKKLSMPILVTRGTKDVNSTHVDYELLKAAATAPGSDAHEFLGLGHEYMPVSGDSDGSEVLKPFTVSPEFLDYLANWIRQTSTH